MVCCGKPSKGCANCRGRKIRCGQEQPTCTNCTKASRICPGYRKMLDLAFRNESSAVIEKAKAKAKAKEKAKDLKLTKKSSDHPDHPVSLEQKQQPRAALAPSIVEQGTSYFITNFVAGVSEPRHRHFNYLKDLCRSGGLDEALSTSMTAVGLACLANRIKSPRLLGET
ncbi:hypothetical protein EAE96_004686 [Botrytis aclada]|nr:hypothetical protein EAE96_004686 [Botrytis aclada]